MTLTVLTTPTTQFSGAYKFTFVSSESAMQVSKGTCYLVPQRHMLPPSSGSTIPRASQNPLYPAGKW